MKHRVLYLGISGVLHPSRGLYRLLHSHDPEVDGHQEFESVPVLVKAISPYPDVRIVLTSTLPRLHGLDHVLNRLGPELASRVESYTFDDLTAKALLGKRQKPMSQEDYWRCSKAQIVRTHAAWLKPTNWLAVDDESILWSPEELANHFVYVEGEFGLRDASSLRRLKRMAQAAFE